MWVDTIHGKKEFDVHEIIKEIEFQELEDLWNYYHVERLDSRKLELRVRPTLNMMIPMNVFEGSTRGDHGRVREGESGDEAID